MQLSKLLKNIDKYMLIGGDKNILGLSNNADQCKKGSLFFVIDGIKNKGVDFVDKAINNGAIAIITNKKLNIDITQVVVEDVRKCMSIVAKQYYNCACDKLKIIGITGTNGKTTSSYLVKNILSIAGFNVGIIGTNGVYIDNKKIGNDLTTPDPINLHKYFSDMVKQGVDYCIMEVSAHAIDLKKVYGIKYRVGLFTNITNEHLDYFGSMKNYSKCKLNWFNKENMCEAVYNVDDDYGKALAKSNNVPNITYGINNPSNTFAVNIENSIMGTSFFVNSLDGIFNIKSKLVGRYNVYNILGAISVCKLLNIRDEYILNGINTLEYIDGRCNITKYGNNYIVIDFAHTPDGFEKVISTFKSLAKGKLITIFGCVDYSDIKKRVLMGTVASKYSDYVILTADNPNFDNVKDINKDIKCGFKRFKNYIEIEDRIEAIKYGISLLCSEDILLILGKGGEYKQLIMGKNVEYNEQEIVNNFIRVGE